MKTEHHILEIDVPSLTPLSKQSKVALWIVSMDRTCLVWLGEVDGDSVCNPDLDNLVVSMVNAQNQSISSTLLNESSYGPDEADDLAESLSRRISNKLKIQIFVSECLKTIRNDQLLLRLVEKKVVEKLSVLYPVPAK